MLIYLGNPLMSFQEEVQHLRREIQNLVYLSQEPGKMDTTKVVLSND